MLPFINRTKELDFVTSSLGGNFPFPARQIIFQSEHASGITSFLKHVEAKLRSNPNFIPIYIDANQNVPNSFFSQFIIGLFHHYPDKYKEVEAYFNIEKKISPASLIGAGLEGIPFVGPLFKEAVKEGVDFTTNKLPSHITPFASASAEVISPFLIELNSKKKLIFIVDNAQNIDEWSLSFLKTTVGESFENIFYISAFVKNRNADTLYYEKISHYKEGYEAIECHFEAPDVNFIEELFAATGKKISFLKAESILFKSNRNLYNIIRQTQSIEQIVDAADFSLLQKETISLLVVADQPLRLSDIANMITQSPELFIQSEDEIYLAVNQLINWKVFSKDDLPDGDSLISINGSGRLDSLNVRASKLDEIRLSEKLFSFYSKIEKNAVRHSKTEVAVILYRLSKIVRREQIEKRGQQLITLSLSMGTIEAAKDFVKQAIKSSTGITFQDFIVNCSLLFSLRSYNEAQKLLENPPVMVWTESRICRILLAITFNRNRSHLKSENLIYALLDEDCSMEEKVLLTSYLISGKIHQNKITDAQKVFEEAQNKYANAKNLGYLLRNGASAFDSLKAIHILSGALEYMRSSQDDFGSSTVMNNLGINYLFTGKALEAKSILHEAYETLETFGVHHLHIVTNNLGIANLVCGDLHKSENYLKRAILLTRSSMPLLYSKINFAFLLSKQSRKEESENLLFEIENEVLNHKVDRVRQRYYINAAIILKYHGSSRANYFMELALKHPDRSNPLLIEGIIEELRDIKSMTSEDAMRLFLPCFLAYWYQNPIHLLPSYLLSS